MAASDIQNLIEAINDLNSTFGRFDMNQSIDDVLIQMSKNFEDSIKSLREEGEKLKERIPNAKTKDEKDALQRRRNEIAKEIRHKRWQQRNEVTEKYAESYLKRRGYANLGGKHSRALYQKGEQLESIGKSLDGIGFSKLGKQVTNLSGQFKGLAFGPLGLVSQGLELLSGCLNKASEVVDYMTEQTKFETQKQAVIQQRNLALLQSEGELAQGTQQYAITVAQNEMQRFAELITQGNGIIADAYASATEISLKSITDISGSAFDAMAKQLDIDASIDKFNKHMEISKRIVEANNKAAKTQFDATKSNVTQAKRTANVSADTQMEKLDLQQSYATENFVMNQASGLAGAIPVPGADELVNSGIKLRQSFQGLNEATLDQKNQLRNYEAQYAQSSTSIINSLKTTADNFNASATSIRANLEETRYSQERDEELRKAKAWLNLSKTEFDTFQKSETAAFEMGRALMYSKSQLNKYAKELSETQISVSKWGKSLEDMAKLQLSFQEETGRNRTFSESDFIKSFANGKLVGDDIVSRLNSGMEIFNMSVADSNDMFFEMYKDVTKMGLSGKKFGKDLVNNLKLAEKYDFKGGVRSLMEMSKWAQNMRFNVSSLDGMLDKVQEGGLEGVIKQAAELQVLGGNFAMGSDPLAMAYEAFADPEAYAKRMNSMIAGQGTFDPNTGQVDFGIASRMIMRQFAKSTGQDFKDVLNQAKQQVKINQIQSSLRGNFTEEQQAMIANKAVYENGTWTVNGKDISGLTEEDIKLLSGDTEAETLEEYMSKSLSTAEEMAGYQREMMARLQNNLWEENRQAAVDMINNVNSIFNKTLPEYLTKIGDFLKAVPETQKSFLNTFMGDDKTDLKELKGTISAMSGDLNKSFTDACAKIEGAIKSLEDYKPNNDDSIASSEIEIFKKNSTDSDWLKESAHEGTKAFNIMKKLYQNFGDVFDKLSDYEKMILSFWDPSYDITSARMTQEQSDYLIELYRDEKRFMKNSNFQKRIRDMGGHRVLGEGKTIVSESSIGLNDGFITKDGSMVRINDDDQVLAAKEGGPIDKMLNMVQPRPMPYNSHVKENVYNYNQSNSNSDGKLEIAPLQINISGNIQVNGVNGTFDLTQQIAKDPSFIRSLTQMISVEIEKKYNGGRINNTLYRSW